MGKMHPKHAWDNLHHFFHISSASLFQSNVTPAAKSLLAGLGFLDAEPAEMSIFRWRISGVIPAGRRFEQA